MPNIKEKRKKQQSKAVSAKKPPDGNTPPKQPFLKRLLFGEEKPDLSELESGSTTILDILSPTAVDTHAQTRRQVLVSATSRWVC